MNRRLLLAILLTAPAVLRAADASLDTEEKRFSYTIGRQLGDNLRQQGVPLDLAAFSAAVDEAMKGKPSRLSPDEERAALQTLQARSMAHQKALAEKNKKAGAAHLAANKKKKGVKTTKSGLQYQVLTPGSGESPKASDRVRVHYKGTLTDGTEFDSSYRRNQPAEFPLNGVIKGWTEGLQLMKPGAKYVFTIPSDLAYGESGRPGIPPNSVLVFEVELLEILK